MIRPGRGDGEEAGPQTAGGVNLALVDLHLSPDPTLPRDVRDFLHEADRRIARFQREQSLPAFVPSDFATAYAALRALEASNLAPGRCFCEWGSGFGVVSCLAALLGFDACGIEAESDLVEAAERLAADFGLPVQFTCGNFLPAGAAAREAEARRIRLAGRGRAVGL